MAITIAVVPAIVAAQQTGEPAEDEPPRRAIVEALSTDRPGFWCGPYVVGTGILQIESGVAIDWSRRGDQRSNGLSTPLVLRYGLSDRVEMRLKTSGLVVARESSADVPRTTNEGIAAPTVEAKWQLTESDGPTLALLLSTALPIGSPELRPGELQPAALAGRGESVAGRNPPGDRGLRAYAASFLVNDGYPSPPPLSLPPLRKTLSPGPPHFHHGLLVSADLPVSGSASISLNAGVVSAFDDGLECRFAQGFFAGVLGFALADDWGGFVEVAATTPDAKDGDSALFIDGGVSWVVNPDLQLDLSAIRGVTAAATDWTAMVGVSLRFR